MPLSPPIHFTEGWSNTGSAAASVNLEFTVLNGAASTARATISIPAGGQFTGFLKQIPGFEACHPRFRESSVSLPQANR